MTGMSFPLKVAHSYVDLDGGPHLTYASLDPPECKS